MRVTIVDIAKDLGISHSTVSRVLNNKKNSYISEETKKKVKDRANEMGYIPNKFARALVTGKTNNISLWFEGNVSHFNMEVYSCIHEIIQKDKYYLNYSELPINKKEKVKFSEIASWPADGHLIYSYKNNIDFNIEDPNCVLIGQTTNELVDSVSFDLKTTFAQLINHVYNNGARKITLFAPKESYDEKEIRIVTFIDTLKKLNIEPNFIIAKSNNMKVYFETILEELSKEKHPDALICFNDELAISAHYALTKLGLEIPKDIMLTGVDDIQQSSFLTPSITTIRIPITEMTTMAWMFLKNRIENKKSPKQNAVINAQLIIRESTKGL